MWRSIGVLLLISVLVGCAARGPGTVPTDAFDYSAAISKARSDQMLLNIVKARYTTVPNFLTVSSVIAGYTYEGKAGIGTQLGVTRSDEGIVTANGNLSYIERPTITYKPLSGEEFATRMMRSIPVDVLFALGQAGWPTDILFRIAVERVGEARNMNFAARNVVSNADQEVANLRQFDRAVNLMMQLADQGALEVVETMVDGELERVLRLAPTMSSTLQVRSDEFKSLLGLASEYNEFVITDTVTDRRQNKILIQTRSLLAIINFVGLGVNVPDTDLARGWVIEHPDFVKKAIAERGPMRVYQSAEPPEHAYAAVQYQDYWYYIDAADYMSKRTFGTIQLLFELLAPSGQTAAPLLTLPAG